MARLLKNPQEIGAAVAAAAKRAESVDAAVAFVRWYWRGVLADSEGEVRVVCWLHTANTNPFAVEGLMDWGAEVRHVDRMHAKLFVFEGNHRRAIIGSANLSRAAMSSGVQWEAAVLHRGKVAQDAAAWFQALWNQAAPVTAHDLKVAKENYSRRGVSYTDDHLCDSEDLENELRDLADAVRGFDLHAWARDGDEPSLLRSIQPSKLTKDQLHDIYLHVGSWCGYHNVFRPVLDEPLAKVRRAFRVAFDEGVPLETRARKLAPKGSHRLKGFGLPTWSLLLEWRSPMKFCALNKRTRKFLDDFRLRPDLSGPKLSPSRWKEWIAYTERLADALDLPSPGHVDRMVWEHTKPESAGAVLGA